MSLLPDHEIRRRALEDHMIYPFIERQSGDGIISSGLSPLGYDARVAPEFRVFTNVDSALIDPKKFDERSFVVRDGDFCIIPPNSFMLTKTVEYFKIPEDLLALCIGKSTYARCGLIVNVTPLNPGWEGHVTIEVSNTTPLPAKVYANEGICQFLFYKAADIPEKLYDQINPKFQGIKEIIPARA
ncbi:MAG: dCTP deaminase [Bdellovibrionales bacterium]